MAASPPILLATSLVPGRDNAIQTAAVASWLAAGFEVISVNGAAEAEAVTAAYPGVTVVPVSATAERFAKKPVPYIHDLLKALRQALDARGLAPADAAVGLINADIYIRNVPGLMATLAREARDSLICGPRIDVTDTAAFAAFTPTGRETPSIGYDAFFMTGALLDDFADSPFCMGMPFWDYWFPLTTLLRGRKLKTLTDPVALHVAHDTRWDDTVYFFFHALIAAVMDISRRTRGTRDSAEGRQFDLLFDVISHLYNGVFTRGTEPVSGGSAPDAAGVTMLADFYDRFQEVAVSHIKAHAAPITPTGTLTGTRTP